MSATAITESPATSLYDLAFSSLEAELVAAGLAAVHARTLWRALYRGPGGDLRGRTDFPPPLRRWMDACLTGGNREEDSGICGPGPRFSSAIPEELADHTAADGQTRKFLLRLADGQTVETVIMGYPGRFTACVSTQVGCAMGCVFCATGQMGFVRHLAPGEIVTQVLHTRRKLAAQRESGPRNLVLMGMGEPLHNYDAVMTALEIISDTRGLNIGPARITLSTVGVVPGILRMAEENRPCNLAVSLHAATDEERNALVPVNRRWPLGDLIEACRVYNRKTGRKVFVEWTLIAGKNDSPDNAARLASLLHGLDAHINLIPLNPTDGFEGMPTSAAAATLFQRILREAGFPSTVRQRRGIEVAAGCGQLRARLREGENLGVGHV